MSSISHHAARSSDGPCDRAPTSPMVKTGRLLAAFSRRHRGKKATRGRASTHFGSHWRIAGLYALAGGAMLIYQAPAAAVTTLSSDGNVFGYQAPDFMTYSQLSSVGGIDGWGLVGTIRDPGGSDNGSFAATIDFSLPTLPANAVVIGASLMIGSFNQLLGLNTYEVDTYTTSSPDANLAHANVRNPVTSFQLYPSRDAQVFSVDVTSAVASALTPTPHNSYIGFTIRQTFDGCPTGANLPGDYYCTTLIGLNNTPAAIPRLLINYDIQSPPPVLTVPEPSTWAMMVAGFGLLGASLRRERKSTASDA